MDGGEHTGGTWGPPSPRPSGTANRPDPPAVGGPSSLGIWTTGDLVARIIADCGAAGTGHAKVKVLADGNAELYAESGDISHIVTRAAASAGVAAEFLEIADRPHLEALCVIGEGIRAIGDLADDLADDLTVDDAARIIFFHFRHAQFSLAVDAFGWGVDRSARWIAERVGTAILRTASTSADG